MWNPATIAALCTGIAAVVGAAAAAVAQLRHAADPAAHDGQGHPAAAPAASPAAAPPAQ